MQHRFVFVDVFNEAAGAAFEGKHFFFASAVIIEFDAHTVVQERKFANTLGQNFVVGIQRA